MHLPPVHGLVHAPSDVCRPCHPVVVTEPTHVHVWPDEDRFICKDALTVRCEDTPPWRTPPDDPAPPPAIEPTRAARPDYAVPRLGDPLPPPAEDPPLPAVELPVLNQPRVTNLGTLLDVFA